MFIVCGCVDMKLHFEVAIGRYSPATLATQSFEYCMRMKYVYTYIYIYIYTRGMLGAPLRTIPNKKQFVQKKSQLVRLSDPLMLKLPKLP